MKLAEAWLEIQGYYQTMPGESASETEFVGGGKAAVYRIEQELGKKLFREFVYYVEKLAPRSNQPFEQIPMPFMTFLDLYSYANLGLHNYPTVREDLKDHLGEPFLIGEDGSNVVLIDLGKPACPVYLEGEDTHYRDTDPPELLAHSLADFLRILFYRELTLAMLEAETNYDDYDDSVEGPRWQEAKAKIKQKILDVAPDCLKAWRWNV